MLSILLDSNWVLTCLSRELVYSLFHALSLSVSLCLSLTQCWNKVDIQYICLNQMNE
jgi:hypothetical protein